MTTVVPDQPDVSPNRTTRGITIRGIRNNNPTNIKHSPVEWDGMSPVQTDPTFVQFVSAHKGMRAGARNLLNYERIHNLSTVAKIINRWAPEDENDTGSYVSSVCSDMGVGPNDKLNLDKDPESLFALVKAMIKVECGMVPYSDDEIRAAVLAAYRKPDMPQVEPPPRRPPPPPHQPYPQPYPQPLPLPVERPVPQLVDQPSGTPTRKVQAIPVGGGAGAALAWTVTGLWNRLNPEMPMPMEVAMGLIAGLSILGGWLAAYFTRNRATLPPPDHYWDPKSSPDPYPARYRPRRRPQPRPYHDDDRYDEDPYEY